jgi:hypothetical protein
MRKFCEIQNILLFLEEIVRKLAFPGKAIIISYFYGGDNKGSADCADYDARGLQGARACGRWACDGGRVMIVH